MATDDGGVRTVPNEPEPPAPPEAGPATVRTLRRPRPPMADLEAEAALLGSVLDRHDVAWPHAERLAPADFAWPSYAQVFEVMRVLSDAGRIPSPIAVVDQLRLAGALDRIGHHDGSATGAAVVYLLSAPGVGGWTHAGEYAAIVARHATERRLTDAAERILTAAKAGDLTGAAEAIELASTAVVSGPARVAMVTAPDVHELLAEPEPEFNWVVPDLLEHEDRLVLTALEGKGKSTLLRQLGVQVASGIHPVTLDRMEPKRVLLLDLENSRRQVRRKLRPLVLAAGGELRPGMLLVGVRSQGLDLMEADDAAWLGAQLEAAQPDLVLLGPVYRLHSGDPTEERPAKVVADVLDRWRARLGFALVVETHCPHPVGGKVIERPYGASLWKRWPEFGIYLSPDGQLRHWRGERDERSWPVVLQRGGEWPWTPATDHRVVTFARVLEEVRHAGRVLSLRELQVALGTPKSTIDRAIKANEKQWLAITSELSEGDVEAPREDLM